MASDKINGVVGQVRDVHPWIQTGLTLATVLVAGALVIGGVRAQIAGAIDDLKDHELRIRGVEVISIGVSGILHTAQANAEAIDEIKERMNEINTKQQVLIERGVAESVRAEDFQKRTDAALRRLLDRTDRPPQ